MILSLLQVYHSILLSPQNSVQTGEAYLNFSVTLYTRHHILRFSRIKGRGKIFLLLCLRGGLEKKYFSVSKMLFLFTMLILKICFHEYSGDAGKLVDSHITGKIAQLKEQIATLEKREERFVTDKCSTFSL